MRHKQTPSPLKAKQGRFVPAKSKADLYSYPERLRKLLLSLNEKDLITTTEKELDYSELIELINKVKKESSNRNQRSEKKVIIDFKDSVLSINVLPSNDAHDYLAKANYKNSVNNALANDWKNVGNDLWCGIAGILTSNKGSINER